LLLIFGWVEQVLFFLCT